MCMKHPKKTLNMRFQVAANAASVDGECYGGNVGSSVQERWSINSGQLDIDVSDDEKITEGALLPPPKNAGQQHITPQSNYREESYKYNDEENENKLHQSDISSIESFDINSATEEFFDESKKMLKSKWFKITRLILVLSFIVFSVCWKASEAIHILSESLEKLSKEPIDWNIYDDKGKLVRVVHLEGVQR